MYDKTVFLAGKKNFSTEDLKETSGTLKTFRQWVNGRAAAMYTIRENRYFLNIEACQPIQVDSLRQCRS